MLEQKEENISLMEEQTRIFLVTALFLILFSSIFWDKLPKNDDFTFFKVAAIFSGAFYGLYLIAAILLFTPLLRQNRGIKDILTEAANQFYWIGSALVIFFGGAYFVTRSQNIFTLLLNNAVPTAFAVGVIVGVIIVELIINLKTKSEKNNPRQRNKTMRR